MNDKKISIIVPVFKVENYLKQCILSLTNQTYKNLEIILVNDGSPDNCGNICDEFTKIDNRIKVLHNENGGLSAARNSGLDIATGDYIGFVDSDDWIEQNMYETLINTAIREGSEIVECKFIEVFERENQENNIDNKEINTFSNVESLALHFNGKYFHRCVWSKLYKKNLFYNLRFPIGKLAEDLYVFHELFFKAKRVSHIDFTGYYYFQRRDSIMGKNDLKLTLDTLKGMQDQHKFICRNAPSLKKYVDKYYFNCLLKSFAFLDREDQLGIIEQYKKFIIDELKRNDIEVHGISKISYLLYKFSPKTFSSVLGLLKRRNRLIAK